MNIEHLRLFVRIASTFNISSAGNELGLSPAVASSHMNKLEEALGVRLINRTTRKVSLTNEGETFLPHAEEILASIETARSAVGSGSITPHGTLRVTAPASFGRMHIIPNLKGFLDNNPMIKVELRFSDNVIDIIEGGFDIAIRDAALNDSSLKARKLCGDDRKLVAAPSYLKKCGEPRTPEDLYRHTFINLMGMNTWVFRTPNGHINIKTNSVVKVDNGEAVRDACVAGLGIAVSSTWCSYEKLRTGELVEILSDYPIESTTAIWALYPSSRFLAPKVRAFIDYFANLFSSSQNWNCS
ncbi:LysR family transcriptional regulator [Shewanella marisflavi]|uniref:LysR family transcriptional regulator n=1 Tax=Shewanella marisflavi TaxID=260364 RepID=A0AAC9XMS8_9GAMM|nr:LysR family transcriptional regulator [Shewanella marisflavi]ASJ95933.1 LysR family transcriptional regulator [Shewanella marisflavi]